MKNQLADQAMTHKRKGQLTPAPQWWKHLRDWKRVTNKRERKAGKDLFKKKSVRFVFWKLKKKIPHGQKLFVKRTLRERDLLLDETFCDSDYLQLAVVETKGIEVEWSLDDIEDVQGFVAAEANHTEDNKLELELDNLSDKLQEYLDSYDDQDE